MSTPDNNAPRTYASAADLDEPLRGQSDGTPNADEPPDVLTRPDDDAPAQDDDADDDDEDDDEDDEEEDDDEDDDEDAEDVDESADA